MQIREKLPSVFFFGVANLFCPSFLKDKIYVRSARLQGWGCVCLCACLANQLEDTFWNGYIEKANILHSALKSPEATIVNSGARTVVRFISLGPSHFTGRRE